MSDKAAEVIHEMMAIAGFSMLDADIYVMQSSDGEDVYVQKANGCWEVYYKNNCIGHSDDEMISGLSILIEQIA